MKKKEEKIEIKERLPIYMSIYDFEGDIEKVIQYLKDIPKMLHNWDTGIHKDKFTERDHLVHNNLMSCHRYSISIDRGYDDIDLSINGFRWETDEEFNLRLDKQKKDKLNAQKAAKTRKKNQEEEELKLFNKLKEKYENRT